MSIKWERVLFKKQNVPDNYVDASFLSNLRKNVNLYHYTWWESFTGVCVVTHEICSTTLFVILFTFLKDDIFSMTTVVASLSILIILCSVLLARDIRVLAPSTSFSHMRSCVVFLTFGYMFSPILKTLTQSISTDTIYAMVTLMMISHVLFQDYGADAAIVSSSLSLNSSLFAAVCLASRLSTALHTFTLVVLAVMIFVLLPLLRKKFRENVSGLLLVTGIFFTIVMAMLAWISAVYCVLFGVLCLCINIVFPALFVYSQKYKENIFGPWDEAIVKSE